MKFKFKIGILSAATLAGAFVAATLAPNLALAQFDRSAGGPSSAGYSAPQEVAVVRVAPTVTRPTATKPIKLIRPVPVRTARANNVNRPRYQAAPVTRATPAVRTTPAHS
jgi:hypothetical protein